LTTSAGCSPASSEAHEARRPRPSHGFATEWCIDDDELDVNADSTGESEGGLPAPSSPADGGTRAARITPSVHHDDPTTRAEGDDRWR
jgi:hypothetical protein